MAFSRALVSSLVLVFLLFSFSDARDHLVGGKSGWKIPNSDSESLNKWAEATRFQVGDSLVWKMDPQKDSVLQVTKEDYVTCNLTSPIAEYKEENAKVKLNLSGPYYFISGAKGHCEKGQKMVVVVMSPRRGYISPAPSPTENEAPAVAPSSSASDLKAGMIVILGSLFGMILF